MISGRDVELPDAEHILRAMREAIREHDMEGTAALLKLLAVAGPVSADWILAALDAPAEVT